jgi:PAS domain S-box-containing protein
MTFSVTEYYMLELIMNEFRNHTKEEIDYSSFIESS